MTQPKVADPASINVETPVDGDSQPSPTLQQENDQTGLLGGSNGPYCPGISKETNRRVGFPLVTEAHWAVSHGL